MKKSKAIIHIGSGYLQIPSIRWARELGLYVVATDKDPAAPGLRFADRAEIIDGTDISSLIKLAHYINKEYELIGVYAGSDFGSSAASTIAEKFSFPGGSRASFESSLDKSISKNVWSQKGLLTPKGTVAKNDKDLFRAVDKFGLPMVVKPINSSGSQGVRSVWNIKDLQEAYEEALNFSDCILVEEFIDGDHADVNGLFVKNEFFPCGIMDRFFSEKPYHYPIWGCCPSSLDISNEKKIYELVERAARILGINCGPVKADVIWSSKGPVILEMAPRFHGEINTAYTIALAYKSSPIKAWLAYLKGNVDFDIYLPRDRKCYAGWIALFPAIKGIVKEVGGIDKVRQIAGVQNVFISAKKGQYIGMHKDNTTVCGFIWATGRSKEELYNTLIFAKGSLEFVLE